MEKIYDLVIVGAGISGTALLYAASNFTNIKKILLLEKYTAIAELNSNARTNAQTLHQGDIETNYTYEKAKSVKESSALILNYANHFMEPKEREKAIRRCQKMVLAVGSHEVDSIEKRFSEKMKRLYPKLRIIKKAEIANIEPNVAYGRDKREEISALYSPEGYMVDFGMLAKSFAKNAIRLRKIDKPEIKMGTPLIGAARGNEYYTIKTKGTSINARFIAFDAGTYSLYFAKMFGYDKNLSILSIGGGYYYSKRFLNGKVYRVQKGGIPFAAIHADPDIRNSSVTRYGPTVTITAELEKGHPETIPDYIKTLDKDVETAKIMRRILENRDIKRIVGRNMAYSLPIIGKERFVDEEARKIIPRLKYSDLWVDKYSGGIRPQIIDEKKGKLVVGEAKLQREGLIFNITPSPGASSCLFSAFTDIKYITRYLNATFNYEKFEKEISYV